MPIIVPWNDKLHAILLQEEFEDPRAYPEITAIAHEKFYCCVECYEERHLASKLLKLKVEHPLWSSPLRTLTTIATSVVVTEHIFCPACDLKPAPHGPPIATIGSYWHHYCLTLPTEHLLLDAEIIELVKEHQSLASNAYPLM